MMTFGSLFAGIGGIDLGLERAGMQCRWQVELDPACNRVLARHWPEVVRYGDVRDVGAHNLETVDVVCAGFPCQDLSVAGKRRGLAGERSGLFFEMVRVVDELRPTFLIWENVPGLLSSNGGADFRTVLRELDGIGYCGAWTCLDAQWFGVAQRRRRIFGVFAQRHIGARRCAEILSLTQGSGRYFTPSRQAGARTATSLTSGSGVTGNAPGRRRLRSQAHGNVPMVMAFDWQSEGGERCYPVRAGDYAGSLGATKRDAVAVAFTERTRAEGRTLEAQEELAYALTNPGSGGRTHSRQIAQGMAVRRLTPRECERLQGFPDDWTIGESDSARYRMLGNAVCVPVIQWIGERIAS